jgi:hypothetical protein
VRPRPHAAASTKGRLIRCTVLGSTPKRLAMPRTPSPVRLRSFRAAWIRFSSSGAIGRSAESFALVLGSPKTGADPFCDSSPAQTRRPCQGDVREGRLGCCRECADREGQTGWHMARESGPTQYWQVGSGFMFGSGRAIRTLDQIALTARLRLSNWLPSAHVFRRRRPAPPRGTHWSNKENRGTNLRLYCCHRADGIGYGT